MAGIKNAPMTREEILAKLDELHREYLACKSHEEGMRLLTEIGELCRRPEVKVEDIFK